MFNSHREPFGIQPTPHTDQFCVDVAPCVQQHYEIWNQAPTDYRLNEFNAAAVAAAAAAAAAAAVVAAAGGAAIPVVPMVPTLMTAGGTMAANFPNFTVGNGAIRHWHAHAETLTTTAGCTFPGGHRIQNNGAGTESEVVVAPANPHGPGATNWHRNWAFGKPITNLPRTETMGQKIHEVKAFFYQLYSRLMFDQSEPPYIHHNSQQYQNIVEIARDPYRLPKMNAPMYQGTPGGMFAGREF